MICQIKQLETQLMRRALSAKGKQWRVGEVIDIAFIGGNSVQRRFVITVANEWLRYANVKFNWNVDVSKSDVRISFVENMGSWSYIGTDALFIPDDRATMNFGWLDKGTVLHEFGHMLGLLHEHQNPDGGIEWNEEMVIRDLSGPPNNWDESTIRHNVLNKPPKDSTNGTNFDPNSVMLYFFPAAWVKSGVGTKSNDDLSDVDKKYISELYPFTQKNVIINYRSIWDWFRSLFSRRK